MNENGEFQFLQDQVQRLNVVLSKYQEKYKTEFQTDYSNISENEITSRPIVNHRLLTPLLLEYDSIIEDLKRQLDTYQNEHRNYRSELEVLIEENNKLHESLKEQAKNNLLNERKETSTQQIQFSNQEMQIKILNKEKESLKEMWQNSVADVNNLERELMTFKKNPRMQALEQQANQIKTEYMSTVNDLEDEIKCLNNHLSKSQNETQVANVQVQELRLALEDIKNKLLSKDDKNIIKIEEQHAKEIQIKELQHQMKELNLSLQSGSESLEESRQAVLQSEQRIAHFVERINQLEKENVTMATQFKTNQQIVQDAIYMRDQCLVKEKQAIEEVDRLKMLLDKLIDEAGSRTRTEVDLVKKQCNQRVEKLMNEVQRLEIETLERQGEMEKLKRERKAAENELESIYREGSTQGSAESNKIVELTLRACQAEKTRDEMSLKVDALKNEMRITNDNFRQDRSIFDADIENLKERNRSLGRDLELLLEEKNKQEEKINSLNHQVVQSNQERDEIHRKASKQLLLLQSGQSSRQKEFEMKLMLLEDAHRVSIATLRQMMNQQQLNAAKYKEECNNLNEQLERKTRELNSGLKQEQKRVQELTKLLRQSRDSNREIEAKLSVYSRNISFLENQLSNNKTANI